MAPRALFGAHFPIRYDVPFVANLSGASGSNGFDGLDGLAGSDGRAGSGGAAGTIAVSVDPPAQPFESILVLANHSGSGQQGPAPTITVESVAPLW